MSSQSPYSHSDRSPVIIACSADKAYALPLAVMLQSLTVNADPNRRIVVYIVDNDIGAANKHRIAQAIKNRLKLHWVKPDGLLPRIEPEWGRVSPATYDKLFLDRFLPKGTNKALWLDSDMLILDDIGKLFDTAMDGNILMAVRDPLIRDVSSVFGIQNWRKQGVTASEPYFNAGVLLIDLSAWRNDNIAERTLSYLMEFGKKVFFHDQEGLNAVLVGRWKCLEDRWNSSANSQHARRQEIEPGSTAILHFSGTLKPWAQVGLGEPQILYFHYVDKTAWINTRPHSNFRNKWIAWYIQSSIRSWLYPLENMRLWMLHRLQIKNH